MDPSESLDLSQLHLTPDWVKQAPETNKYADYKGDDREGRGGGRDRRDGGGGRGGFGGGFGGGGGGQGRGPRRDDGPRKPSGDRRDGGGSGGAPRGRGPGAPGAPGGGGQGRRPDQGPGQGQGQRRPDGGGNREGRSSSPEGGGNRDRRGKGGGDFRGGGRGRDDRFREPLPAGLEARFLAETAGVESLARQIKATGRAYSVFDLAKLVLSARERYAVEFVRTKDAPESTRFFQCKLDGSLWLSKEDALRHALSSEALAEYYTAEEVETEGPKGNFTVIAVCGMSGVLLGPPNHHDYQRDLVQLHQERFANMNLEAFKRRIRMEKDEETIEKWKAQKSKETHYTYQKTPEGAEPVVLKSLADMERHCRENHLDDFVVAVDSAKVPGNIPAKNLAPPLLAVLRNELEQQKRFPMNTVKILCRQLEDQGLKFFKDEDDKKKKTTFVCRSRPRALQSASGLSERIRRIVGLVRDNPGIDYAIVVSSMLPGQKLSKATTDAARKFTHKGDKADEADEADEAKESIAPVSEIPVAPAEEATTSDEALAPSAPVDPSAPVEEAKETAAPAAEVPVAETPAVAPAEEKPAAAAAAPTPEIDGPSEAEIGILKDLRWLIREGYVVEYSSGAMRLARNAAPRKRPAKKKKAPVAATVAATAAAAPSAEVGAAPVSASDVETVAVASPPAEAAADQSPAREPSAPATTVTPARPEAPAADEQSPAPEAAPNAEAPTPTPSPEAAVSEAQLTPAPPAEEPAVAATPEAPGSEATPSPAEPAADTAQDPTPGETAS